MDSGEDERWRPMGLEGMGRGWTGAVVLAGIGGDAGEGEVCGGGWMEGVEGQEEKMIGGSPSVSKS